MFNCSLMIKVAFNCNSILRASHYHQRRYFTCQQHGEWDFPILLCLIARIGISKDMAFQFSLRPSQQQQPFKVIITADVVSANVLPGVFPGTVRMSAKSIGDLVGVPAQNLFQFSIAGKCVPKQTVQTGRANPWKRKTAKRRVVRNHNDFVDLGEGSFQVPFQS